jgi:hypothetical protein
MRLAHYVACCCLVLAAASALAQSVARIVVQHSPLAGFQYYDGKSLWNEIKVGDQLTLAREPDNPHDTNAVRIDWNGRKLGYVPRRENAHLARQMDRGAAVEGRIMELHEHRNGRNRISYEISVALK